jgi:hypothetical protein
METCRPITATILPSVKPSLSQMVSIRVFLHEELLETTPEKLPIFFEKLSTSVSKNYNNSALVQTTRRRDVR